MVVPKLALDNTRKKSVLVEWLPWIGRGTCTALYPYVYLSREVYTDVHSARPDPYNVSRVIHEQEHIKRIREHGVARWYAAYAFNPRFRLNEELAAMAPQLNYIKSLGLTFNVERTAGALSGWLYLWTTSYEDALRKLKAVWEAQ